MSNNLRARLRRATDRADIGTSQAFFKKDPLFATNRALRYLGAPQITDINSRPQLIRAISALESEED